MNCFNIIYCKGGMAQCKRTLTLNDTALNKIRHGLISNCKAQYLVRQNDKLIMVQGPHEFMKVNDADDSWIFEKALNWSQGQAIYVISYPDKNRRKYLGIQQVFHKKKNQTDYDYIEIIPGIEHYPWRFRLELDIGAVQYVQVRVGLDVSHLTKGRSKDYNYVYWKYSAESNSLEYAPLTNKDDPAFIWRFEWLS